MKVSRPRVESELQLPTYTTATGTPDLSCVCNLHHSLQQHWSLSGARGQTHILMDASQVHFCWATMGTPLLPILSSAIVTWPTATLRKLQQDCILYQVKGWCALPFHHGAPPQYHRSWYPDPEDNLWSLTFWSAKHTGGVSYRRTKFLNVLDWIIIARGSHSSALTLQEAS